MLIETTTQKRELKQININSDFTIVGGGLSGVCAALNAARSGLKVALIQDRPVLGGNSSSEVRLWILGATSHMGNNNRWAREGGVVDEILVENTYKNPEGNPLIFDSILLDKVYSEKNIQLFLNTAIYDLDKRDNKTIWRVTGFCSQNSTTYTFTSPLFCDASGDGIIGFLAGAAFRMGAESTEEFGEKFAPQKEYGELLGHSLYFYSKDIGKPVKYSAPDFALKDIQKIPRFKRFNAQEYGCKLWWIEYGGRLDTIHDTEEIKLELWKVVYGVWDYIKNSGNFPEAANLTLEWVGMIPGKRESRRFEGDYMMIQQDIVEQRTHLDAVAYGGWSIDLHPADGVFSDKPGCNQWHSKGIYQIPLRSLYSKNIDNLFLTGRIISASHVAFGSTRVMATGGYLGQVVGQAAFLAVKNKIKPKDLLEAQHLETLKTNLYRVGHYIPDIIINDDDNKVQHAKLKSSSNLNLKSLGASSGQTSLTISAAQVLPLEKGKLPVFQIQITALEDTQLNIELRKSSKVGNFTPDILIDVKIIDLEKGTKIIDIAFENEWEVSCYAFLCFMQNPLVSIAKTNYRITGIISVFNLINKAVSNFGKQTPPEDIGVESFEFWCAKRRPDGENFAINIEPALTCFTEKNITKYIDRPTNTVNAWVAAFDDKEPQLEIIWESTQKINQIDLMFDTDYDHPMESVLMEHPENVMPFCIRNFKILDENNNVLIEETGNYQTKRSFTFKEGIETSKLIIAVEHPSVNIPAAIFAVRCY